MSNKNKSSYIKPQKVSNIEGLFDRIVTILEHARAKVVYAVNSEMIIAYWMIGHEIVQVVQLGDERASYGKKILQELSEKLFKQYGKGFSVTNLRYFRLFYQTYSDREPEIRHKPCDVYSYNIRENQHIHGFPSILSWPHYRTLTKVENSNERLFYEIEAEKYSVVETADSKPIKSQGTWERLVRVRPGPVILKPYKIGGSPVVNRAGKSYREVLDEKVEEWKKQNI